MKQQRLVWLVGAMIGLGVLRLVVPEPRDAPGPSIAEPIVHRSQVIADRSPRTTPLVVASADDGRVLEDVPGNAFAVRVPPAPPAPAPMPVAPKPAALPTGPAPAPAPIDIPPSPAPYRVIGTWDDGKSPGVFLTGEHGAVLARQGTILNAEYKVTLLTSTEIALTHLTSRRETRLAIVRPATTQRSVTVP